MAKTILKKVPDEDVWYRFEDEVDLNYDSNNIVICGNRDFQEFGDKTLIDIIKGDYYDDDLDEKGETIGYDYDVYEELKKVTGKDWEQTTIRGYCQSDWQEVWYVKDEVSQVRLKEIEDFYMGKISELHVTEGDDEDSYVCYVPDDVFWKGKQAICDYIGIDNKDVTVLEPDGYTKVYNYKEVE